MTVTVTVVVLAMLTLATLITSAQIEGEILLSCHILETHTFSQKRLAVVEKNI
jgi:hypothetical protein